MMPSRYRAHLFNAVLGAFGLVSVSVIAPAHAAGPELTICGGVIDGRYNKFASDFGAQLRDILVPKVLVTEGSLDNLSKLSSGECAAGLAQADAMFAQQQRDPNFKLIAEVVGTAYDEVAHLVCPKSADIRSIKDVRKRPGDFVLFVGPQNGGSQITWETITRAVKEYSAVPVQYVGGQRAITRVVDGPNSFELGDKKVTPCIFWIGGVGAGLMKDADDVRMKLVDIDDGDIVKNAKDKFGKPLYEETKISSKIYPKMGDVHTFSDVSSIKTHAVLMVSTNWADANAQTYDLLLKRFRSFSASQQSK